MRDINAITSPLLRALNRIRKITGAIDSPKFRSNFRGVGTGISRNCFARLLSIRFIHSLRFIQQSPRWSSVFVSRGLETSTSRSTTSASRRHGMSNFPIHHIPSALTIHTPPITWNHTNITTSDPPETPNPSKSSEPTTPSPNAPRTSPPNKRAMPDHTRRLLSTGHERNIG